MKNSIFAILLLFLAFLSCGRDEDSIQKIDQILNFYMKDAVGNDLLKPNEIGAFTTITMNDMLAPIDNAPVSSSRKATVDSINYIEYIAGATRELVDGSDTENRTYRSKIRLALTKKLTDSTFSDPVNDTLEIFYRYTPQVFEVSEVKYNQQSVFTKVPDQPNVVTIIK